MKNHLNLYLSVLLIIAFTSLFYLNKIGINLFLFEILIIPMMVYANRPVYFNNLSVTLLIGTVLTAFMSIIIHTPWTIAVNLLLLIGLSTSIIYSGYRSFAHLFVESIIRLFTSHFSFFKVRNRKKSFSTYQTIWKKLFYYVCIPLVFLSVFFILYVSASSTFEKQIQPFINLISNGLELLNAQLLCYILAGFLIANIVFKKTYPAGLYQLDFFSNNTLVRKREKYYSRFKFNTLKIQYRSAVILFSILNLWIFYFNVVDISYVWFFQWDGGFLKEFVHEGTWLLVFSILLSVALVLYYFRGNLNFYTHNKWIKRLAYVWIAQNIFMVCSVIIRNYWYIHYFGLAYKRIAVLFFLLLTLIGLMSVFVKIMYRKSSYFLWRVNSFSLLIVLSMTASVNWNTCIARYNFAHYNQSFIEYRFLSTLHDSALPFTLKTHDELKHIDAVQENIISFDRNAEYFWTSEHYQYVMEKKRNEFMKRYQSQNFLEWNLADYITFKRLNE